MLKEKLSAPFKRHSQKKILYYLKQLLGDNKLNLCDVGGAGGISPRWNSFSDLINLTLFEPDERSAAHLRKQGYRVIQKGVWSSVAQKDLYLTRKERCSSLLKPNMSYLARFKDAKRFDIIDTLKIETTTLDNELDTNQPWDFIKLDIQGAELEALKGSMNTLKSCLGLEIEVEFIDLYENQPLFCDFKKFAENQGFHFIDFISLWRYAHDGTKYNPGDLTFGDVLFLRFPEYVVQQYQLGAIDKNILNHYIFILSAYNRTGLLTELQKFLKNIGEDTEILSHLIHVIERRHKCAMKIWKISHYLQRFVFPENSVYLLY